MPCEVEVGSIMGAESVTSIVFVESLEYQLLREPHSLVSITSRDTWRHR
jgi:hypothetical protein